MPLWHLGREGREGGGLGRKSFRLLCSSAVQPGWLGSLRAKVVANLGVWHQLEMAGSGLGHWWGEAQESRASPRTPERIWRHSRWRLSVICAPQQVLLKVNLSSAPPMPTQSSFNQHLIECFLCARRYMYWTIGTEPLAPRKSHVIAEHGGLWAFIANAEEGTNVLYHWQLHRRAWPQVGPEVWGQGWGGWGLGSCRKREETLERENRGPEIGAVD